MFSFAVLLNCLYLNPQVILPPIPPPASDSPPYPTGGVSEQLRGA